MKIAGRDYHIPSLVVLLMFLTGTVWIELDRSQIFHLPDPALGGVRLRYYDPIFLFVALAIAKKLLEQRPLALAFSRENLLWVVLLVWLALQIVFSLGRYSLVNNLGEFRTYYHFLLIIPFVSLYFPTENEQWKLFRMLIVMGLSLIVLALYIAAVEYQFSIRGLTTDRRWLRSTANLGMLYAFLSLLLAHRFGRLRIGSVWLVALGIVIALITLINSHRSVWLAMMLAFALIPLFRIFNPRQLAAIASILAIGMVLSLTIFSRAEMDLTEHLQERSKAFTSFEDDGTASWRYLLWLQALDEIRKSPVRGVGYGRHFQMLDRRGNLVTTYVHNYYITIAYHAGITALLLYLAWLAHLLYRIKQGINRRSTLSSRSRIMLITSFIVLLASHVYYVAFGHDTFTMFYAGLATSICVNNRFTYFRVEEGDEAQEGPEVKEGHEHLN